MAIQQRAKQVFGSVVILVGCAFAFPLALMMVSGHIENLWKIDNMTVYLVRIGALVLFTSLSVYLICTGLRMVNPRVMEPFRFGWGKILFGSWVLFSQVSAHYHLIPEGPLPILKPSNAAEGVSMKVTGMAMCLLAVYLIFRGIRAGFSPRESLLTQIIPSPPQH
jgi:hypothetical protein